MVILFINIFAYQLSEKSTTLTMLLCLFTFRYGKEIFLGLDRFPELCRLYAGIFGAGRGDHLLIDRVFAVRGAYWVPSSFHRGHARCTSDCQESPK